MSKPLPHVSSGAVPRRYFGTDGVRGIVGEDLTPELVERLGRAATLWSGRGRIFVGRDTRASGLELEDALARGIASVGGNAVVAGVLPTPAVALLTLVLGCVITAAHNPPEYNGVKFFDRDGQKLSDTQEEEIEALLDEPATGGGEIDQVGVATDSYLEHVIERFGSDLTGLRIGVDFDGDGDRMLAVDGNGDVVDGDQILAVLALDRKVDLVAVTVMANMGLHRLMAENGVRVVTTDVGDRYVLEALRREGGILGGEQSGHLIWLDGHVTGDGLVAALLLCNALHGRPLAEVAAVMARFPQARVNVSVAAHAHVSPAIADEVVRLNAELGERGRVLVRASGTEPVIRVLAEAETGPEAESLCGTIAALVRRELG